MKFLKGQIKKVTQKNVYKIVFLVCMFFTLILASLPHLDTPTLSASNDSFESAGNVTLKASSNGQVIIIQNNYELNQTASSGNGTLSNPYIIEDKSIDANGNTFGILINNTNKYFSLINCTVFNASYGVFLHNVSKGTIYDCDIRSLKEFPYFGKL